MADNVNSLALGEFGIGDAPADASLSMAERAYRTIRDQLVMLDIAPGRPINEDQVSTSLAIGRTPVREALKRLEHERLVVSYPRRGTFATDVNITDLTHISEVRQQLEPVAAAAAAIRATADERDHFDQLADHLDAMSDDDSAADLLMRLDLRVHRAMYAATHNPFLEDTLVHYDNLATRIWCIFLPRLPGMAGHVGEHSPLLRAIVRADDKEAARLATGHVLGFEQEVRSLL